MAGLRDLLKKENPNGQAARKLCQALQADYPYVAEILGGLEKTADSPEVAGGTITIFVHEGKARFTINVKDLQKTFIGDLADILNPWGSINSALGLGDVSSKRYIERGNSYTEDQKKLLV